MTMDRARYEALLCEKAELESLVGLFPNQAALEVSGLSAQLAFVTHKLEMLGWPLAVPRKPARAFLTFDGAPVLGRRAIDAMFASRGLRAFQEFASVMLAERTRGKVKPKGVIPDKEYGELMLTGLRAGSFGFILEEKPFIEDEREEPYGPDLVSETLVRVCQLLAATSAPEKLFTEALAEVGERAHSKLVNFLSEVADAGATLRLSTGDLEVLFESHDSVQRARERVEDSQFSEEEQVLEGTLYYLPGKRRFELYSPGSAIEGGISVWLTADDLEPHLRKTCLATVVTRIVERRGRRSQSHLLVQVEAPPPINL